MQAVRSTYGIVVRCSSNSTLSFVRFCAAAIRQPPLAHLFSTITKQVQSKVIIISWHTYNSYLRPAESSAARPSQVPLPLDRPPCAIGASNSCYFYSTATVDILIQRHSAIIHSLSESNSHLFHAGRSKSHPPHAGTQPKPAPSFPSKQKSQAHQRNLHLASASNNSHQSFLLPSLSPPPECRRIHNIRRSLHRRIQQPPCALDYSSFHKRRCASSSKRPCGGDYAVVGTAFTKSFTSNGRTDGRTDDRSSCSQSTQPVGQR